MSVPALSSLLSILQPGAVKAAGNIQPFKEIEAAEKKPVNFGPATEISLSKEARAVLARMEAEPKLDAKSEAKGPSSPTDEFLKFAKMTPAEKYRAQFLSGMGLTEESLRAMDSKEREKIEEKIKRMIEEKLAQETGIPTNQSTAAIALAGIM